MNAGEQGYVPTSDDLRDLVDELDDHEEGGQFDAALATLDDVEDAVSRLRTLYESGGRR